MGDILFLTHRVPWPPNRGDKIRAHHILRKLMEYAPVHLACFADDDKEAVQGSAVKTGLASVEIVRRNKSNVQAGIEAIISGKPVSLTSFDSAKIRKYVTDTIKAYNIDCIFVFSGQMAQYIPENFSGRVIMDFADVDSAKFESYANEGAGPMAWVNRREGRMLRAFERQVAERADYSLFVSEAEAQLFRQRSGLDHQKVKAIGNGIDLDFYDPNKAVAAELGNVGPLIIFTGQMDYRPNVEAVISFSKEVMPDIQKLHPRAQFAIVGRAPTADVARLDGQSGTIVVGSVDDIRCWLKAADIVVAPLRIARGIQNKVLEAMAMGKAVVASSAAAQGIEAVDGQHFQVAASPAEEAKRVCELLSDPQSANTLGYNAAALIRETYSWDHRLADIACLCGLDKPERLEAAE